MPNWKKVLTSGSAGELASLYAPSITGSLLGTASYATQALSSSYALNGGVTQLLAGPNITLSPTTGKGQVTISATAGGPSYNTATGSYGSFYDTTTQTNPVGNIPRLMSFNTTDITNGVSISGSTSPYNTYIKTENPGVYNIQFSAQIDKTDAGTDEIVIWLSKNGIDLADTATTITLSGNNDKQVAAWNWFVNSAANDYYQIIWYSADTDLRLLAETAGGGHPGIPSVILTVNRVDQFLSNTGSFSGSFTGQLIGTASWATNAITASYVLNAVSSSFASTASYVNSLNQDVIITGSLIVSASGTTNDLLIGSNKLFVSSSGDVGIGITSSLNAKLHVNNTGAGNSFLVEDDTNPDSTPFVIGSTGNVSIGTGSVGTYKLDVVDVDPQLRVYGTSNNRAFRLYPTNGAIEADNTSFYLNRVSTTNILLGAGGGNTGVGSVQSPAYKLHVSSSGTTALGVDVPDGNTVSLSLRRRDNDSAWLFNLAGNDLRIYNSSGSGTGNDILFGVDSSGNSVANNVGIGKTAPNAKLDVSGSTIISGSLTTTSSVFFKNLPNTSTSNTVYYNTTTGELTYATAGAGSSDFPYTGSAIISGSLIVTGSVNVTQNITGSRMYLSGSIGTVSGSTLILYGSGSTNPIFTVQGSQGELFSVTDNLSGSLFSVNDISGLPVLEAFSDNTVLLGSYQDPMLITTTKLVTTASGAFNIYSLPTASYDTAFYEYSIRSGSNARAGSIMAIQSGSSVNFTETTTTDFGSTAGFAFTVLISGASMILTGSATTSGWTIKTIVKGL